MLAGMGLVARWFGIQGAALEADSPLVSAWAAALTSSGVRVDATTAVANVAVLACLIVRAESLMLCPVDVHRRRGGERIPADGHPVAALMADPNPLLSDAEFWRWKQLREDLTGAAFARIEWAGSRPVALWPWTGAEPEIVRTGTTLGYRYEGDDFTPPGDYPAGDVIHFKGPLLSGSPYRARSLVEVTADNIGVGLAAQEFFGRFLANGTHFPTYLSTDQALSDADVKRLREQMSDGAGLLPAGQTRVFDRGLKVQGRDMSLRDADLSGHQRWVLEQVCRTWRVPPQMVQDLSHGTYTNSEQADLWLSKHTVAPIARNTERALRRALFRPGERADMSLKFNVSALLRGDFATRTSGYSTLIAAGVMSPNEARAFEDWGPYEGGDAYRAPLNTAPVGSEQASGAVALLVEDARGRVVARRAQDVARGRGVDESREFAARVVAPIVAAACRLGVDLDGAGLVDGWLEA